MYNLNELVKDSILQHDPDTHTYTLSPIMITVNEVEKSLINEIYLPTLQFLNGLEEAITDARTQPKQLFARVNHAKVLQNTVEGNKWYNLTPDPFQSKVRTLRIELESYCREITQGDTSNLQHAKRLEKIEELTRCLKRDAKKLIFLSME